MSHPVFPGRGPTSPIQIASRPDPRISPRAQLSLTAWITATLTAGVCAFGAAITPSLDSRIVFASLALGAYLFALLALIAPAEEQFGLPRLRLASWLLFYSVFAYGLATVTLASPQEGLQAVLNRETTIRAIVFVAIALTVMTVAYRTGPTTLSTKAVTTILTMGPLRSIRIARSTLVWLLSIS